MKVAVLALFIIALIATSALADQAQLKAKFAQFFTATGFSDELKADVCKFGDVSLNHYKGDEFVGSDPTDPDHYKYTLDFCAVTKEAVCAEKKGSLCQYDVTRGDVFVNALASFTAAPAPTFQYIVPEDPKSGYQLTFTNGDQCYQGFSTIDRTVIFKLTCDTTNKERKFTITEPSPCTYEVDVNSNLACSGAGSDGISGGAIFLIVFFVTLAVYFIVGFLICKIKFGQNTIAHAAFWTSLPGLYIAGCSFVFGKLRNLGGSKTITTSSGEYEEA